MTDRALRIGIDARAVCYPKTGDRSYTLGLIDGLARVRAEDALGDEFVLYFDQEPPEDLPCMIDGKPREGWSLRVLTAPHRRLWTLRSLPRAAREDRLDLLHVQYNGPRIRRPALVTTVHDISFRLYPAWFSLKDRLLLHLGLRSTLGVARQVLAVSECTRKALAESYGYPCERIAVTHNALPPGFAAPSAEETEEVLREYAVERPYVLFVGVLQPRKNLPRAIRAFSEARRRGRLDHRLVLVGKRGWRGGETERAIDAAGDDLQPLGYVPDAHLPALYAGAEVLLYPSLYEGFGIPVLEAFACGTAVLTSNVSALPEVAGDAALLVDPRDEQQIAERLLKLTDDASLRETLIERGRRRLGDFDWRQTARLTLEAYRRAVEA